MTVYNNPAIGEAAASIAQMFAPPSGSDAAGWAAANAKRAEAKRAAEFFTMATSGADKATLDRYGVGSGAFTPNQSFGMTMRGQDLESGDRRYGVDVGAATSRGNNAADNTRALQTNIADNSRAIQTERLKGLAGMFGPLGEGQVRPALPSEIASQFGAPGPLPQAEGRASPMSSDETIAAVMGGLPMAEQQQFARDKFAPSETQVKGAERRRLAADGTLTDQNMLDTIMGADTPVQAIGPDGKTPTFMSPGAAVRSGAQPYDRGPATVINNGPNGVPYGEPEKGTVWARNPDGTVKLDERGAPVAIPYQGGSVFRAQQSAENAAGSRARNEGAQQDVVMQDIDRALAKIEANPALTTGVGAQITGAIGGSPAYDVNALVDTAKAKARIVRASASTTRRRPLRPRRPVTALSRQTRPLASA